MRICLIRHGKPKAIPGPDKLTAEGFGRWLREFDATGIDPWACPPEDVLETARKCRAVVTSQMERAHASARFLFPGSSILVEPLMNECGLPSLPLPLFNMAPSSWAALCRSLWFLGYCRGTESVWHARSRAARGAELLIRLAANNGSVAMVGHGMMNTFIGRELRRQGWSGPAWPGSRHWDMAVYTSMLEPIKGREVLAKRPRVRAADPAV